MYLKSDNIEVMVCDKTDEAIEEPFKSLFSGYQIGLERSMRSSKFIFDFIYCATNAME